MADIPVLCREPDAYLIVARNWARRFVAASSRAFGEGATAVHPIEERTRDRAGQFGPHVQWVDVRRAGEIVGRVRVAWEPGSPRVLRAAATSDGVATTDTFLSRSFAAVAKGVNVLAVVGAVGAFGLWVWFAIHDWTRIWNRLSSLFSATAPDRASKLEVMWLLVGWAVGPAFVGMGIAFVAGLFTELGNDRRAPVEGAIPLAELDAVIAADVRAAAAASAGDTKTMADLGQLFPGRAHPVHPNVVASDDGNWRPAPGFAWVSDAPGVFDVKPAPPPAPV